MGAAKLHKVPYKRFFNLNLKEVWSITSHVVLSDGDMYPIYWVTDEQGKIKFYIWKEFFPQNYKNLTFEFFLLDEEKFISYMKNGYVPKVEIKQPIEKITKTDNSDKIIYFICVMAVLFTIIYCLI